MVVSEKLLKIIRSIRGWLKDNHIFFSTIGTILLSIMAIYVAYGAYSVTSYQSELMEHEHFPFFNLAITPIYDDTIDPDYYRPNDYLKIDNLADPITEFYAEGFVFINITNKKDNRYIRIPISGYYRNIIPINNSLNNWHSVGISGNFYTASKVIKNFTEYANLSGITVTGRTERVVKIQFRDRWGEKQSQYFFIREYSTEQISETQGSSIVNEYDQKIRDNYRISTSYYNQFDNAYKDRLQGDYEKWIVYLEP